MSQTSPQTLLSLTPRVLPHQSFTSTPMADSIFTTLLNHAGGADSLQRGYCQPELPWEEHIYVDVVPFFGVLHDARQVKDQLLRLVMSDSKETILEVLKTHSGLVSRVINLNHVFHTAWTQNPETKAVMYLTLGLIFDVMKSCEDLIQVQVKLAALQPKENMQC